jgi:hypothetical protein
MSPQFLEATIPLSMVVRTARTVTVVLDPEMNRAPVPFKITRTRESLGAERAGRALSSLDIHGKMG